MARQSAGLLVYRHRENQVEFFLIHPGGPFWKNKDAGAWSIPKGEYAEGEDALDAAKREFLEETGNKIDGRFTPLTPIKQRGGKIVHAWLVEAEVDPTRVESNSFSMEWPPRSGRMQSFPEVDRADWFRPDAAKEKILASQLPLLDEAASILMKLID
jgi:predicted NUDIX family NTP pyrophosphohydrolase